MAESPHFFKLLLKREEEPAGEESKFLMPSLEVTVDDLGENAFKALILSTSTRDLSIILLSEESLVCTSFWPIIWLISNKNWSKLWNSWNFSGDWEHLRKTFKRLGCCFVDLSLWIESRTILCTSFILPFTFLLLLLLRFLLPLLLLMLSLLLLLLFLLTLLSRTSTEYLLAFGGDSGGGWKYLWSEMRSNY